MFYFFQEGRFFSIHFVSLDNFYLASLADVLRPACVWATILDCCTKGRGKPCDWPGCNELALASFSISVDFRKHLLINKKR